MRITLFGVLGFLAVASLLIYVAYKLHRRAEENKPQPPPPSPGLPPMNP